MLIIDQPNNIDWRFLNALNHSRRFPLVLRVGDMLVGIGEVDANGGVLDSRAEAVDLMFSSDELDAGDGFGLLVIRPEKLSESRVLMARKPEAEWQFLRTMPILGELLRFSGA